MALSEIPMGNNAQTLQITAWDKSIVDNDYRVCAIPFVGM